MPTVLFVDVLDDLFASLVFEIDIDIGSFVPLAGDEPFEEQIVTARIDAGDPQTKADSRIGCRPTPLA